MLVKLKWLTVSHTCLCLNVLVAMCGRGPDVFYNQHNISYWSSEALRLLQFNFDTFPHVPGTLQPEKQLKKHWKKRPKGFKGNTGMTENRIKWTVRVEIIDLSTAAILSLKFRDPAPCVSSIFTSFGLPQTGGQFISLVSHEEMCRLTHPVSCKVYKVLWFILTNHSSTSEHWSASQEVQSSGERQESTLDTLWWEDREDLSIIHVQCPEWKPNLWLFYFSEHRLFVRWRSG